MTEKEKDFIGLITDSVKDMFEHQGEVPMMLCYSSTVKHMKKIAGTKLTFHDILDEHNLQNVKFHVEAQEAPGQSENEQIAKYQEDTLSFLNLSSIMNDIANSYKQANGVQIPHHVEKKIIISIILKVINFFDAKLTCHISEAFMIKSSKENYEDVTKMMKDGKRVSDLDNKKEILSFLFEKEGFMYPKIFLIHRDSNGKPKLVKDTDSDKINDFKPIDEDERESNFNDLIRKAKELSPDYKVESRPSYVSGFRAVLDILKD